MLKKTIIFTGGGSAGHVSPNLVLIPIFQEKGWRVVYFGSKNGIEKQFVDKLPCVEYLSIPTGKLRRYFSWKNFWDLGKIMAGIIRSAILVRRIKASFVFSKGGFVSFPVIVGSWLNGVPIVMHESDLTPGLANRLSAPFATKILTTFLQTKQRFSSKKVFYVGPMVRKELFEGKGEEGRKLLEFSKEKPILLVIGGSLGAVSINQAVRNNLAELLKVFQVVHITGKSQLDSSLEQTGYKQFEFVGSELADIYAVSDLVVSRSGSNTIFELLMLRKPMILVPLPLGSSRGDQIRNAEVFRKNGYAEVIADDQLKKSLCFLDTINKVYSQREIIREKMKSGGESANAQMIFKMIAEI